MFWLHIPKCGTSFLNVVVHLPGACDALTGVPIDAENFGECFESNFNTLEPVLCHSKSLHFPSYDWLPNLLHGVKTWTHSSLYDDLYVAHRGHFVALFRQPEQRLLSQWFDQEDNFRAVPFISRCDRNKTPEYEMSMSEFQQTWAGAATAQLSGAPQNASALTEAHVEKALVRLREGFAFVGLEEEWALSVCLFHMMFGGPCLPLDFENTRPGATQHKAYDLAPLNGWRDVHDGRVYDEAQRIFQEKLADFGVSHQSCKSCYEEAAVN